MYFTGAMANAYAMALRERAVGAYRRGDGTLIEVAATFTIDPRTLQRWVARVRDTGSLAARPKAGGWRCPIVLTLLHAVIAEAPDATSAELCWEYNRRASPAARTTVTSFRRAMHREGYVLKKNGRGRARSIVRTSRRSVARS
jgi:transposase